MTQRTNRSYVAQIPAIKGALNGHLQAVDFLYAQLKHKFNNRDDLNSLEGVINGPGEFAPLVVNIAFSLELLLKLLLLQDNPERSPDGHNLSKLWNSLSSEIREPAERKYEELLRSWDESDAIRYVAIGQNGVPEPVPKNTISKALKNMRDAFVEWRYSYEYFGSKKQLIFSFVEAKCALGALHHASMEFKGGIVVQCKME